MLKINNLYKSYRKKEVLKGVDFALASGELKGLIGVNGAGKTTLIECICGIKNFDKGSIIIDGIDICDKKHKKQIKFSFGYMPQNFTMFNDLTTYENLLYVASIYNLDNSAIDDIIKLCMLEENKNTLAENLSGGYKQLLSLACAIIHKPKLLILDEPTSAMDPLFRNKFWDIIHKFHQLGASILLITHYVEEVNECKNFMCLSNGKIVYDGGIEKFLKNGFLDIEEVLKTYQ